jgi:ferredoxin
MAFTITRLCIDCVDTACVRICPVDCIYSYTGSDREGFPNQLYIEPEECIDCGACEPECPWGAIFQEQAVPAAFADDVALNHAIMEHRGDFAVAKYVPAKAPTPEQVAENKRKWSVDGNLASARMSREYKHNPRKRA